MFKFKLITHNVMAKYFPDEKMQDQFFELIINNDEPISILLEILEVGSQYVNSQVE